MLLGVELRTWTRRGGGMVHGHDLRDTCADTCAMPYAEIEIDLDKLDTGTLRHLDRFSHPGCPRMLSPALSRPLLPSPLGL